MYNAPSTQTGSGQQLAIITEGDVSQPKKDLATFEQQFGLPAVTWNQINAETPSTDTSGDDEWDLDSQYSTGFAPGVTQLDVYVGASLSDQDIVTTVNRWVTDDISKQGSFSPASARRSRTPAVSPPHSTRCSRRPTPRDRPCSSPAATPAPSARRSSASTASPPASPPASPGQLSGLEPLRIGVGGTSVLSPSGPTEIAWYAGGVAPVTSSRLRRSSHRRTLAVLPAGPPRRPGREPRRRPRERIRGHSRWH